MQLDGDSLLTQGKTLIAQTKAKISQQRFSYDINMMLTGAFSSQLVSVSALVLGTCAFIF